jgi:hypothetical protein
LALLPVCQKQKPTARTRKLILKDNFWFEYFYKKIENNHSESEKNVIKAKNAFLSIFLLTILENMYRVLTN